MKRYLGLTLLAVVATACQDGPTINSNRSTLGSVSERLADASVVPVRTTTLLPGKDGENPACSDFGYPHELKIDHGGTAANGTWPVVIGGQTIGTITVTGNGTSWNFSSTFGIDAAISKGGNDANLYRYSAEIRADTNLVSPVNASGGPAAISHLNFCFDIDLASTIDADLSAKRTFDWTVEKTTNAAELLVVNKGVPAPVTYTVTANPGAGVDSAWKVTGTVRVENEFLFGIALTDVSVTANGDAATVACDSYTVPAAGSANGSVSCSYTKYLADASDVTIVFTADAQPAIVRDPAAQAGPIAFQPSDYVLVNEKADITDSFDGGASRFLYTAEVGAADNSFTYQWNVPAKDACDYFSYTNVATIKGADTQTGGSDDAKVNTKVIGCIGLAISVSTSYDRTWTWTIDKSASASVVSTTSGQEPYAVHYTVVVSPTKSDGNYAAGGAVTVTNEAAYDATIVVTGDASCTVALAAGASTTCNYSLPAVSPAGGSVSASATVESSAPVTATAPYGFGAPANVYGGTVQVFDRFGGDAEVSLGSASEAAKTFTYQKLFGGTTCGTTTYENAARFASSSGQTGGDSWSVEHTISGCTTNSGCTLTQGYWKTHSTSGPAAHADATWTLLPNAQHTVFYLSNQSWLQVFRTAPSGNAYYTLAHQYMAARLNVLNGASTPAAVADAIAQSEAFFAANVPVPASGRYKGKDAAQLSAMAALLDQYNNGMGPGHCSENPVTQ